MLKFFIFIHVFYHCDCLTRTRGTVTRNGPLQQGTDQRDVHVEKTSGEITHRVEAGKSRGGSSKGTGRKTISGRGK